MGDINPNPVWKELLKQAEQIKKNKENEKEVEALISFIKENLNSHTVR